MKVLLDDQIACVRREIGYRKRAYPRWVSQGKMQQSTADQELKRMEAVLVTLEEVARTQAPFGALSL